MPDGAQDDQGQVDEDPRKRDYPIIVGVHRYPRLLLDGKPADLQGPINDAQKVRDWIVCKKGGGVPPENVAYVVRADKTPDQIGAHTRCDCRRLHNTVWAMLWARWGASDGPPMGRRLYVYVSGHGLAADLEHGALLCSNSSVNGYSTIAPFHAIKAFWQAGFFEQFVVWFDGCMDWAGQDIEPINYVPRPGNALSPGPVFVAYGAASRVFASPNCVASFRLTCYK